MSEAQSGLRERIAAAREAVRRDGLVALIAAGAVTLCVAAALGIALGAFAAWRAPSPLPLALDLALVATLVIGGALLRRRWLDAVDETRIAGEAERVVGVPAGALRGALELLGALPPGASPALARSAEERARAAIASRPAPELGGELAEHARRRARRLTGAFGIGAVALAAAGFVMPEASERGIGPLLDPIGHLSSPPFPPLRVAPGDASVARGESLSVAIEAPLRNEARIRWWAAGSAPGETRLALTDGGAVTAIGPIDARTAYVVTTPDGAASDTFVIEPVDPLMLSELALEARYPGYLEREPEVFTQPLPSLSVPEGTELRIRGRATSALSRAELLALDVDGLESGVAAAAAIPLRVAGSTLSGSWRPSRSGDYRWDIRDAAMQPLAVEPPPLSLIVVADSPPAVRVTFPGEDTIVPPDMRMEVIADAEDDHGIVSAEIVSWRVSALGQRDEPVSQSAGLAGSPERALLRGVLALEDRRLMPGDTLRYLVRVVDDSPRRQVTESRTYSLVFPRMHELRGEVTEEAQRLVDEAGELARRAEELASEARDASRRMAGGESDSRGRTPEQQSMPFGEADRLARMAEADREMLREVEEMSERLEALQRAMEAAGLQDPELQRQLDELRDLYESVLTEELRADLAELQRGLDELDPEQVRAALERLAEQQEQVRQQLERSLELFRRAAAEQEMSALAQDARELAGREEAVAAALADSASASRAIAEQSALGAEAEQLETRLAELGDRLSEMGEETAAEQLAQAARQAESAQQAMSQASQQARAGENQQAGQDARQAAQQMSEAAQQTEAAREQMAEAWREEAARAVQQATQDVLSLAQEQEALRQRMEEGGRRSAPNISSSNRNGMKADQAALQQGLEAMGSNLSEAGQRSAMVSREVGAALGRGMVQMDDVQESLADESAALPVEQARQAVEALNQLAMELLANADRIEQSENGTGLQQALEQMAQMAREQGALNAQASAMMPLALAGAQMATQAERLAQRQRAIGEGLDRVQRDMGERGDVLGRVDELAREAAEIARQMERDGLRPETIARQERLFHRLLDAGRTLERDETSEERRAERPGSTPPSRVPSLDASATRGALYPPPSEAELRRLSPAYRRLILDYFDRLNRAAVEGAEQR